MAGEFDLVVIGGGVAGTTASISAARLGFKVALIQDRPVLGGNNGSELKNKSLVKEDYRNRELEWVAYIAGKRESRRLLGDLILKEQDIADYVI